VVGVARRSGVAPQERGDVELLESSRLCADARERACRRTCAQRGFRERRGQHGERARRREPARRGATFNRSAEELPAPKPTLGSRSSAVRRTGRSCSPARWSMAARCAARRPCSRRATAGAAREPPTSLLRHDRRSVLGAIATFVDLTRSSAEDRTALDRLALGRFT
jgi:hypothetical protein